MSSKPRILIVDDDPIVAETLAQFLSEDGYPCSTACDGNEASGMLDAAARSVANDSNGASGPFGVVITDVNMPRRNGMELLKEIKKKHKSIVAIMITGFGKIESAVEAVKQGATDYLTKPLVDDELRLAVSKAVQQQALLCENVSLKHQLTERYGLDNMIGSDYRMQKIYDLIEAVSQSQTTALIEGESGTGKTMVARAIHERSPRRGGPLLTFSCGSIPETLMESELFGHVKGAFTGADQDRLGKILSANSGTLFIDEINSATGALQLRLLRVLQERQFEPVGSSQTVAVDVRFVLASNEHLQTLVQTGSFREDLFYRINVVNIKLPPLRERAGDVPLLAEHFLAKYRTQIHKERTLSPKAMEALCQHDWPGNVRELENAIERAVVLSRQPVIMPTDLPEAVLGSNRTDAPYQFGMRSRPNAASGAVRIPALQGGWNPMPLTQALEEPERQILLAALNANNWNRQATARDLNINRTTLYKKMKQYCLDDTAA